VAKVVFVGGFIIVNLMVNLVILTVMTVVKRW
jgi:hypothetical protein